MTGQPHRRFHLRLSWGADSREDMAHVLRHIAFEIQTASSSGRVTAGAPCDGGHYDLVEDPEMTHERYIAAIHAWLEERKGRTE